MARRRVWLVFALAAVCGGLAAYFALDYVRPADQLPAVAPNEPERRGIVVAARDLPRGHRIQTEDVRLIEWPAGSVPTGYQTSTSDVVGRGVTDRVRTNEPLLSEKLASSDAGGGLPIVIPAGMRAMSIAVDEVIGVAGFVLPGTHVDVVVTLARGRDADAAISRIVLQDVLILAANQTVEIEDQSEPSQSSVVTVAVRPAEAELLALAANEGTIQLALRNALDLDTVPTTGARVAQLLGQAVARPEEPARTGAPPPRTRIEVLQGGERTTVTF